MASRSRAADAWWRPTTSAALAVACALLASAPAGEAQAPSLADLVRAYIDRFEHEASALVAEEHYTQIVTDTFLPSTRTQTRVLRSDFVLVKPADSTPWLGYRDVFAVDGKDVRERDARLLQILQNSAPDSLARAQLMADEGARFNIGPPRTINVPTMPLQLLASRHQEQIRLRGARPLRDGSGRLAMTFDERGRPTIVRTPEGDDVKTSGEIVVRPDGTIVVASLVFRFDTDSGRGAEFKMRVYYSAFPEIPVLLPVSMTEEMPMPYGKGTGQAHYSNYRRFQTTARIR